MPIRSPLTGAVSGIGHEKGARTDCLWFANDAVLVGCTDTTDDPDRSPAVVGVCARLCIYA